MHPFIDHRFRALFAQFAGHVEQRVLVVVDGGNARAFKEMVGYWQQAAVAQWFGGH